jgi:hypothetical protein
LPNNTPSITELWPSIQTDYPEESIFLLSWKTKKVRVFPMDIEEMEKKANLKEQKFTSEMMLMWARYY